MKNRFRVLALLCALCLLFATSCVGGRKPREQVPDPALPTGNDPVDRDPDADDPLGSDELAYTLTDADREHFSELLDRVKTLILTDRSDDEETVGAAIDELEDQYYHIATQNQIAYIRYCMNEASQTRSDAYLYASSMLSDCFAEYQTVCLAIDRSDAPYREAFFADWTEEEIEEMRGFSEEQTRLSKTNDELLVQFRSLSEADLNSRVPALYLQFVRNNDRIAELNHCETYADYAYAKVYARDYTPAQAAAIHSNVKQYLAPLGERVASDLHSCLQSLNENERRVLIALFEGEYGLVWNDIQGYLAAYPEQTKTDMASLFEPGNLFLTSSEKAHAGAFTAYLYEPERPICYFGPGYHSAFTILHEMGHYYAAILGEDDDVQMDLAETQSQSNEWLFAHYLVREKSENLGKAIYLYQLYSALQTIVLSSIIDEFEQSVYREIPANADELETRMRTICEGYGGETAVGRYFGDPQLYWRSVTMESPCYYVSYAFSMLVATSFYDLAEADPAGARETYLTIAGGDMGEMTYAAWLTSLGMQTPFDPALYQAIVART